MNKHEEVKEEQKEEEKDEVKIYVSGNQQNNNNLNYRLPYSYYDNNAPKNIASNDQASKPEVIPESGLSDEEEKKQSSMRESPINQQDQIISKSEEKKREEVPVEGEQIQPKDGHPRIDDNMIELGKAVKQDSGVQSLSQSLNSSLENINPLGKIVLSDSKSIEEVQSKQPLNLSISQEHSHRNRLPSDDKQKQQVNSMDAVKAEPAKKE